jgi:hypothetical protein
MSENPWYCATSAPHSPTRPFDSASVRIVVKSVSTPRLRIICLLLPVAWIARPRSVDRNQSTISLSTSTPARKTSAPIQVRPNSCASRNGVITVSSRSSGTLAPPMMRRFTDHRAIIVRMPASSPSMCPLVCSRPVTMPAIRPAAPPASVASTGLCPATIIDAATAAPVVKLPSTVRSGNFSTRKVR